MEDYDVFNEMQNIKNKESIIIVEDDENFVIKNLLDSVFEVIPIRFSYDLSYFSDSYIDKTKKLFTFYYNENNSYKNELLRLKKHFIHYQRKPSIAYIPNDNKYIKLEKTLTEIGIKCISNKQQLINMLNKKLIFIDSDGTLKKSDGTISERVKKAIQENKKIGNRIIICTARPRYQTLDVMKEVGADSIIVSSNGSEIYDSNDKNIIFNSFIDKDSIIKLVEYAYSRDIRLILTMEDYDYVTKDIRNSNQKLLSNTNYANELAKCNVKQCMFIDKKSNEIYKIKDILSKNDKLHIVDEISDNSSYEEKWFSVANSNCSKGNALMILSKYLNIPIQNTIAIGNDKNDITMFEVAGLSVAVSNASDNLKNKVDYVTLSNNEDGVAIFLETLL
jgi:hypothetical protein